MAKSINEIQDEIIDEFEFLEEWLDRYQLIIDYGKELPPMAESDKVDKNLIDGCQSKVWFTCRVEEGKIYFSGDSDAILVKGIVGLLLQVLSGHTPQEIIDADLYFIDRIGLREHLSPTRSNGIVAMLKQLKLYALAYSQQANS
jgi:cysteine desulfuration protein SufE